MQNQKLCLPEEFALLGLVKESGYFEGKLFQAIEFYTVASCFIELCYRGKLTVRDNKVVLIDGGYTGIRFLDAVLETVAKSRKERNLPTWYLKLAGIRLHTKDRIAERLVELQILEPAKKHILNLVPVDTYIEVNQEVRKAIIARMRDQMLGNQQPDRQTPGLLLLLKQVRVWKEFFSDEEQQQVKEKLDRLVQRGTDPLTFELMHQLKVAYTYSAMSNWGSYSS